MEKVKLYIIMFVWTWLFVSCSNSNRADSAAMQQYIEVFLTLDFPCDKDTRSSRGFVDGNPAYDETTALQKTISDGDIYILCFKDDRLVAYRCNVSSTLSTGVIKLDFQLNKSEVLGQNIEFVILANLTGNVEQSVPELLSRCAGLNSQSVFEKLVYPFAGEWDLHTRRIPMWGVTPNVILQPEMTNLRLSCALYRAVAKIGFRINVDPSSNRALGYPDKQLRISKVVVRSAMDKGFVAPLAHDSDNMAHTGSYPSFIKPFIPSSASQLETEADYINKSGEVYTREFIDAIYLPEQETEKHPLYFDVFYSLNGSEQPHKTIPFIPHENVIRNHSYIYNIRLAEKKQDLDVDYVVVPWDEHEPVELPPFQ